MYSPAISPSPPPSHFDFGTPPPSPPPRLNSRTSSSTSTTSIIASTITKYCRPSSSTSTTSKCGKYSPTSRSKSKHATNPQSIPASPLTDKYSTAKPWYHTTIGKRLGPEARELLENYSRIPPGEVDAHVYKMRDLLWNQTPYPSIGNFSFLTLRLLTHPLYPRIVQILSAPSTPSNPSALFLDLGCCVGQELRSLAHHARIPPTQLYGTDYNGSFLKTSYKIFLDTHTPFTLLQANILDPNFFPLTFRNHIHQFSIIHCSLFMHLFTWEQQLLVCENVVRLLRNVEGALFVGCMVGKEGGGEGEQGRWLHDADSWVRLWGTVWERLGMSGSWKVQGELRRLPGGDLVKEGEAPMDSGGEGIGLFEFSVERTGV
ncbi:cd15cb82-5439-4713-a241-14344beb6276 [Sclerotinia trifoliorum]|uniref:Cd15cb82-5439-4713-a241-14344beb6276 n=1 Tax=Sclerotinia trifoliorum TaxID=28548 RepID=A0A8H2W2P1_9HELO|nr:cd15cb82-5439-4713-a241-14344beb6276 [Sclerotinia trifoliorum]